MKQLILWAASTLLYVSTASAQSCTPAPSCSALGYTQSSSTCNSAGLPYIVCPFDSSKVFCGKVANDGPHVGDLKYSLYSSNHDGWLLCNGTQYSQSTYSKLYGVIGTNFCHKYTSRTDTSYSSSNCKSGYFAVPDYRGFFLRALNSYNSTSNTVGGSYSYSSNALYYKGAYSTTTGYVYPWVPQYEQLPNITGGFYVGRSYTSGGLNTWDGAFSKTAETGYFSNRYDAQDGGRYIFNASKSNAIYDGSHVMPASYGAYVFIYAGQ